MKISSFKLNEIGGRPNLEDAICPQSYAPDALPVFVVCDGVGGSSFGEVASDIASKTFYNIFTKGYKDVSENFGKMLTNALDSFKKQVREHVETNPGAENTSTTLTLIVLKNNKAYVAWCGDSKIYQIRNGKLLFKSRDHSLVNELVMQGIITEEQALTHPQRNVITRSLSSNTKQNDIEYKVIDDVKKEDWFLLCTDGLLEQFTEASFPSLLSDYQSKKQYDKVIKQICEGKTKDNFSMYLLNMQGGGSSAKTAVISTVVLLLLGASGLWAYNNMNKPAKTATPAPVEQTASPALMIKQVKTVAKKDSLSSDSTKTDNVKKDSTKKSNTLKSSKAATDTTKKINPQTGKK